jgi:NAD(P)-dependent dehydrogenase (short-subunit alcohol dehydrogenase family)
MFAYRGSTAMITGASKGLGAAFAKELAGRGMNLVLVARSIDALQDLADSLGAQYGVRCVVLQADLAAGGGSKVFQPFPWFVNPVVATSKWLFRSAWSASNIHECAIASNLAF